MKTVFIVDDDPAQVELSTLRLGKAGFDVHGFLDPFSALTAALDQEPDVMVVDYLMPCMDGLTLIRELRKSGVKCKFILVSGVNAVEDMTTLEKRGVSKYLAKPEALSQLTEEVQAVLQ